MWWCVVKRNKFARKTCEHEPRKHPFRVWQPHYPLHPQHSSNFVIVIYFSRIVPTNTRHCHRCYHSHTLFTVTTAGLKFDAEQEELPSKPTQNSDLAVNLVKRLAYFLERSSTVLPVLSRSTTCNLKFLQLSTKVGMPDFAFLKLAVSAYLTNKCLCAFRELSLGLQRFTGESSDTTKVSYFSAPMFYSVLDITDKKTEKRKKASTNPGPGRRCGRQQDSKCFEYFSFRKEPKLCTTFHNLSSISRLQN